VPSPPPLLRLPGDYEVVQRLATGGVAELFRAVRRVPGQPPERVVVKRLREDRAGDPFFAERFLAEADLLLMVQHPNVVRGHHAGRAGGLPYLVMEEVAGLDLRAVVRGVHGRGQRLADGVAVYVVTELLRGLSYLHTLKSPGGRGMGMVHRDVTPENVLVGEDGRVVLADLGVARVDGMAVPEDRGRFAGKLGYLAPEQVEGGETDARTDIFAAGCILYELTCGCPAFSQREGELEAEALRRVAGATYTRPVAARRGYPGGLEEVVVKALARKSRHRFQDADDFLVALLKLDLAGADARGALGRLVQALQARAT
jgi:serine/threonine-protein kinase